MSLDADLLDQAAALATLDPGRPRQANLRRAVSAAYYAVFHLLVRECAARITSDQKLRRVVGRSVGHAEMKKVCQLFSPPGGLQEPMRSAVGVTAVPPDLRAVAETFALLQLNRHEADYDVGRSFRRAEVLNLVTRTREAFAAWGRVRDTREARVFLLALAFGDRWKR